MNDCLDSPTAEHQFEEPGPNGYAECTICHVGRLIDPEDDE